MSPWAPGGPQSRPLIQTAVKEVEIGEPADLAPAASGRVAKQVAASCLVTQTTQPNHLQPMPSTMYDQKLPLLCYRQREASAPMWACGA